MEQPEGFKVKGKENYVCKLKKSHYGLKQAPKQWYKKFESAMEEQGYKILLQITMYLHKVFLMVILSSSYYMWMIC